MVVKIYDEKGVLKKSMESDSERLYPGSASRFLADGENLAPGKYNSFLLLDNGDGRIFGDTFELLVP